MFGRNLLLFLPVVCFAASVPPEADQRLAHEIYKEIVEIKSGFTTGATTPVAQAIANGSARPVFQTPTFSLAARFPRKPIW